MYPLRFFSWCSQICILFISLAASASQTIELESFTQGTVGKHVSYFQEQQGQILTLEQARTHFNSGEVYQGTGHSISLGIGVAPVWLKFSVNQQQLSQQDYRLFVETPWLDKIDSWVVNNGQTIGQYSGGDGTAFEERPIQYRFFGYQTRFPPGQTDIYLRVETLGPMALPVRLSTVEAALARDVSGAYEYGFLYGILMALCLYNLMLYIIIRQKEYGLYSLYLLGFVLNSLSYTGQIHTVFTPHYGPYFQDWVDAFLMITYSVAGLHFARFFTQDQSLCTFTEYPDGLGCYSYSLSNAGGGII